MRLHADWFIPRTHPYTSITKRHVCATVTRAALILLRGQVQGGTAMNTTNQPPAPVDPLRAAIEPFRRNIRTVCKFYWEMAWRPRHFAEEHIRTPEVTSISRAVKHFLWLATYRSTVLVLATDVARLMGQKPTESEFQFAKVYETFIFTSLLFVQIVPMAAILWLLTRRRAFSFSQSLLIFIHSFNVVFAAMLLVISALFIITLPFLYAYRSGFMPALPHPIYVWLLIVSVILSIPILYIEYRTMIVVPANLTAGALDLKFWQGLWRYGLSVIVVLIPILLLLFVLALWGVIPEA
jgi:hypothetical protein